MKRLLFLLALMLSATLAQALPTQQEVEAAVRASRYSEAESMMREVVTAKPDSAKARYIYAEILAHNRQFDAASTQLREARRIDPATKYAEAARVDAFEKQLDQAHSKATGSLASKGAVIGAPADATPAPTSPQRATALSERAPTAQREGARDEGGIPGWVIGAGFAVVAVLVVRALLRRRQALQSPPAYLPGQPAGWGGAQAPGYGPGGAPYGGYPPQPVGGGALRTGMAVAGGVAAGMLLDRMINSNTAQAGEHRDAQSLGSANADGVQGADDTGFERRPVDFGQGEGWGGGSDASGGGGDGGGDGGGGGEGGW
jgi:hypothetical protein